MKRLIDKMETDVENDVKQKQSRFADVVSKDTFRFDLYPVKQFDKTFPYFRKPVEIGFFSQDSERKFCHDRRQLRYLTMPSLSRYNKIEKPFDLREGYKEFIRKDENFTEKLDDMFRWIMLNKNKFSLKSKNSERTYASEETDSIHTDFLCWRGLLTKLLCIPYENRDDMKFAVSKYRGTYYLCEFDSQDRLLERENRTQLQDEQCYWGWKFEQYVTANTPDGKPETRSAVNNKEGFCSVVRTRLGSHSVVFGGEVDALDPNIPEENKYVELKTSRVLQSARQEKNFKRFKMIRWWAQSFLIGISKIICGFRDDKGTVVGFAEYKTHQIPDMIKEIDNPWNPSVCFNFLAQFLQFLKDTIRDDDSRLVHLVTWKPQGDIVCQRLERNSDYVFIPEWFENWDHWKR